MLSYRPSGPQHTIVTSFTVPGLFLEFEVGVNEPLQVLPTRDGPAPGPWYDYLQEMLPWLFAGFGALAVAGIWLWGWKTQGWYGPVGWIIPPVAFLLDTLNELFLLGWGPNSWCYHQWKMAFEFTTLEVPRDTKYSGWDDWRSLLDMIPHKGYWSETVRLSRQREGDKGEGGGRG